MYRISLQYLLIVGLLLMTVTFNRADDGTHRVATHIATENSTAEYCESEDFHPVCGPGKAILIHHAVYGRMKIGKCITDNFYMGCTTDVLRLIDTLCSGLSSCNIRIPYAAFDQISSCYAEVKTYLEASYSCVRVSRPSRDLCGDPIMLYADVTEPGFLMTDSADRDWCGHTEVQWMISAMAGQKLNISLIDFSPSADSQSGSGHSSSSLPSPGFCTRYGEINEASLVRAHSICRTQRPAGRTQYLYVSETNMVTVTLNTGAGAAAGRRFMIMYKAVGCPDPETPEGTWFTRLTDEEGEFGCPYDHQVQRVYCVNNVWHGLVSHTCQPDTSTNKTDAKLAKHGQSKPGATALLAAGIACGLTVVIFILGILVTRCVARYRVPPPRSSGQAKPSTMLQVNKGSVFPPDLYSRGPPQQCGLCTEVAPFLTTTAGGKSATLRYQCVQHGGGTMSPPADWIYQCATPTSAPMSSALSSGTPATASTTTTAAISHESILTKDTPQMGGEYALYMCPGHDVNEPGQIMEEEAVYRRPTATVGGGGQSVRGEAHPGVCLEQYGGVCTTCDCSGEQQLEGEATVRDHAPNTTDASGLDIRPPDYNNSDGGRLVNIHAPPVNN